MAINQTILQECIRDQREMIENAQIVERQVTFEPKGNYVFVGIRHSGKSYLLYQRIHQLLKSGHNWDEILFVNFDDERLAEFNTDDFNSLLEAHYSQSPKKPFIFLDEVQRIPHWELFARRLVNEKYIVYITGSNAKMLSEEIATTLGGRFFIQYVYPYSFAEYLAAQDIVLSADWVKSTRKRSEVKRAFDSYFFYGGLPEILDYTEKRSMLSSLYQKIYLGDICARYKISDTRALSILVKKIAESVKQPISYRRLHHIVESTGSKISLPKIIDYVGHTEESWLTLSIQNDIARLADKESTKKFYFIDNGLLNLFLFRDETSLLENMVAIELVRRYGKEHVSYYNAGGGEIDFVVPEAKLAIQVSYDLQNEDTLSRELSPLRKFQTAHPDWQCFIITFDTAGIYNDEEKEIKATPIWQWLLNPVI